MYNPNQLDLFHTNSLKLVSIEDYTNLHINTPEPGESLHKQILTNAKAIIKSELKTYACHAIEASANMMIKNNPELKDEILQTKIDILNNIKVLLGKHPYLESWLSEQLNIKPKDIANNHFNQLQETRLAWLDWMIKQKK